MYVAFFVDPAMNLETVLGIKRLATVKTRIGLGILVFITLVSLALSLVE